MAEVAAAAAVAPAPGGQQAQSPTGGGAAGVQAPGGEQKAPSLMEELGVVLKKHGGVKYKANGKEVGIEDPAVLVRRLQNLDGLEATAQEHLRLKSEVASDRELKERLKSEKNPRERVKILRQLHGEDFDAAAEAATLERFEQAEQKKKLSPEAQRYVEERDAAVARAQKLEDEQAAAKSKADKEQNEAEGKRQYQRVMTLAGAALQKVGIKPEVADRYMPEIAGYLYRAGQLNLDVSPEDVTELVVNQRDGEATEWIMAKSDESLLDLLEKAVTADPADPKKPGQSRAVRLANLMAKRLLDKQRQVPNTGTSSVIPNGNQRPAPQSAPKFSPSYWNTVKRDG